MRFPVLAVLTVATPSVLSQVPAWERAGGATDYISVDPFEDINGDGYVDLLAGVGLNPSTPSATGVLRIISGLDGLTLYQRPSSASLRVVGDFDLDGRREYVTGGAGIAPYSRRLELRNFATGQILWSVEGPSNQFFGMMAEDTSLMADLDLTGDGRLDLLAITSDPAHSIVYAYNNAGAPLYQIALHPYGWVANNVTAMPDLDGDGAQDFLVGCIEPTLRGAVAVVSGRTGTILRLSYGVLAGDIIGGTVCNAGDIDQDGVPDYAAASYWSAPRLSIVIFSGRTGVVLRNWTDWWTEHNGMTGDVDVDLDGIPDLIVGGGYAVRAYSGRDGTVLWNLPGAGRPWQVCNLGARPGNPYPLLAFRDHAFYQGPSTNPSFGRIAVFHSELLGAGAVSSAPCSNSVELPLIGMRTVPGHVRVTVSNGPRGAIAMLAGGPADWTSFGSAPLPYALDAFGLFGCSAYVPPVVVAPTTLGISGPERGYAYIDLPWPVLSPAGHAFAAQWLLLDPANGAYALTARHEFRVP